MEETGTTLKLEHKRLKTKTTNEKEGSSDLNINIKDSRKGKPIPGFAREVIVKVAEFCELEAKNNCCKYPVNAPTKRAAMYTGVSQRTIQRIRNEDRKKKLMESHGKVAGDTSEDVKNSGIKIDHPDEESNYNTMKRKSKRGQTIPNSARDIISKVIDACDQEQKNHSFLVPLISKSMRTALYTGVSQRTVQRIRNEGKKRNQVNPEKVLTSPGKKRKRATFNDKIDDFDFQSIRKQIDDFILVRKIAPTCAALLSVVKEKIHFPYSEETLYRLLHSKGFVWHKCPNKKRILTEKPEIFQKRLNYLREIKKHEADGRFIVYLDERWIGRGDDEDYRNKNWMFKAKGGIYCSRRMVVVHRGSVEGLVSRAEQTFKPNSAPQDPKIKLTDFEKWFQGELLPNIPSNSVIVMSTAPYNTQDQDNSTPNEYSLKSTMVSFLKEKSLKHDPTQTRADLYQIIKNYLDKQPCEWSQVDRTIESYGHIPLRLPSYMSEFNPIELAWVDIKRYIRGKNQTNKITLKVARELTYEAIDCFTSDTWQGYVNHVIEMEDYFWEKESLIQEHLNNVTKDLSNETNTSIRTHVASAAIDSVPVSKNTVAAINTTVNNTNISSSNFIGNSNIIVHSNTIINHSIDLHSNDFPPMLPHNQMACDKELIIPVFEKTGGFCPNQDYDGLQPGPSYLDL